MLGLATQSKRVPAAKSSQSKWKSRRKRGNREEGSWQRSPSRSVSQQEHNPALLNPGPCPRLSVTLTWPFFGPSSSSPHTAAGASLLAVALLAGTLSTQLNSSWHSHRKRGWAGIRATHDIWRKMPALLGRIVATSKGNGRIHYGGSNLKI